MLWPSTTLFWAQLPITDVWPTFHPTSFRCCPPYDIMMMTKRSDDDVQQSVKGGVASWENQDWWEDSLSQHEDNPAGQHHQDHEDNPAGQHHHDHEEGWHPDAQHLSELKIIFFIVDVGFGSVAKINNILRVSMRTIQQVDTIKIRRNMKLVNLANTIVIMGKVVFLIHGASICAGYWSSSSSSWCLMIGSTVGLSWSWDHVLSDGCKACFSK